MAKRYIDERLSYARCNTLWKEREAHVVKVNSKGDYGIRLMDRTYLIKSRRVDWKKAYRPVWQVVWTTGIPIITFYPCGTIELPMNAPIRARRMWSFRQRRYALKGYDASIWGSGYHQRFLAYWRSCRISHRVQTHYLYPWIAENFTNETDRYVVRFRFDGSTPIPVGRFSESARLEYRHRLVIRCDAAGRLQHVEYGDSVAQPCVVVVKESGERFLPKLVKRKTTWTMHSILEQDDFLEEAVEEYVDARESAAMAVLLKAFVQGRSTARGWEFRNLAEDLWRKARKQAEHEYPEKFVSRGKERRLRIC